MQGPDRRGRVLAELGIVRWRLRERTGVGPVAEAVVGEVAAQRAEGMAPIGAGTASDMTGAALRALAPDVAAAALRVSAPDAPRVPTDPAAAAIWAQVLDWLGHGRDEVAWCGPGEGGAVVLPPVATWRTPEGKRGLWQALKAHVRNG